MKAEFSRICSWISDDVSSALTVCRFGDGGPVVDRLFVITLKRFSVPSELFKIADRELCGVV